MYVFIIKNFFFINEMEVLSDYLPDVLADIVNRYYAEMKALDFRWGQTQISQCLNLPLSVLSIIHSYSVHEFNTSDARAIRVKGKLIGCIGNDVFWLDKEVNLMCNDTHTGVCMLRNVFQLHKCGMYYVAETYRQSRIYNSQFEQLDTLDRKWAMYNDEIYYVYKEVLYKWGIPVSIQMDYDVTYCMTLHNCMMIRYSDDTVGLFQTGIERKKCQWMYEYFGHVFVIEQQSVHDITTNTQIVHGSRSINCYAHGAFLWFDTMSDFDVLCDVRDMSFTHTAKEMSLKFKNGFVRINRGIFRTTHYIFQ